MDAVVVLSSRLVGPNELFAEGVDRLHCGIALVRSGTAPLLITTRQAYRWQGRTITSDAAQRAIVPSDLSWCIAPGVIRSTYDEAVAVSRILPGRTVLVVTCEQHVRRAVATFRKAGLDARGHAAPERAFRFALRHRVRTAIREAVAWQWYWVRGYL